MKYVIIGTSAAGLAAAQKLKQLDPNARVLCVSNQIEKPYNKCLMADFVAGIKEDISFIGSDVLASRSIELMLETEIVSIDTTGHELTTMSGQTISYEKLLIATGARAWVPSVSWFRQHQSIVTFHTLSDAQAIKLKCAESSPRSITILGGGLSGIELADALAATGHSVTVVEKRSSVLHPLLSSSASDYVIEHMHASGVSLYLNTSIEQCLFSEQNRLEQVVLSDGLHVPTDLLVIVTGQRANTELARASGIHCSDQGIVVDQFLATSAADVYAAGDCIRVHDQISGMTVGSCTWPDAMFQGALAAHAMADQPRPYPGPSIAITSSFFDLKMATTLFSSNLQVQRVPTTTGFVEIALEADVLKGYRVLDASQKKAVALKRALVSGLSGSEAALLIQSENI